MTQGPFQETYGFPRTPAFAGLVVESLTSLSRINSTKQLVNVLVDGAANGNYIITIDGEEAANFERDSAETVEAIRDELITQLEASGAPVTVEAVSTDQILIEKLDHGDPFTIAVSAPSDNLVVSNLVGQNQEIPFGLGVVADDRAAESGKQCRLPRQATDITTPRFLGLSAADTAREPNQNGWPAAEVMRVLRRGRIWVVVEEAVAEGVQLFCRYTATSTQQLGAFRSDADSSTAAAVPGLVTERSTSGAGIVLASFAPQT